MRKLKFSVKLLIIFVACHLPFFSQAERNPFFPGSSDEYPQPIYFDAAGNGVEVLPLMLDYDLSAGVLQMGSLKMQPDDFYVDLVTLKKNKSPGTEDVFVIQWPENFMHNGTLELISRTGKILWSKKIEEIDLDYWKSHLAGWKTSAQYGIRNATSSNTPLWDLNEPFRACLTKGDDKVQTRLCSAQFRMEMVKTKPRIFKIAYSPQPPRVILNNQQAPLKQSMEVKIGEAIQFYAELSDGSSYEFYAIPKKSNLVDITGNKEQTQAIIITEGEAPLQPTEMINKEKISRFLLFIGWEQTIGDFRQYWRTKAGFGETQIMLPGEGGGAFLQRLKFSKLPTEEMRPFLSPDAIQGTYVDGSRMSLKKPPKIKVSSKQNRILNEEKNDAEFVWEFGAKKRGEMNRSYLSVNDGQNTFKAYHELYKAYPREFSLRSVLIGDLNAGLTFLGEVAFNYWFEDVLGSDSLLFSRQRWGVSSKYFRSMGDLKVGTGSGPFDSTSLELKYRFTPGLWARTESWGAILGYQKIGYSTSLRYSSTVTAQADFAAQFIGVGGFWARSMPRIFDDIFNIIPFMRYPKWVDVEFIYYPSALSSEVEMTQGIVNEGNFVFNFHGQVMWSQRFFGEAGFGLKQYQYYKKIQTPAPVNGSTSVRTKLPFTAPFGTVGIGYRF